MRLATKSTVFYATYIIGGVLVGGLALTMLSEGVAMSIVLTWFLGFGIAQFVILRCPYCRRSAIKTPSGAFVPWTGRRCRYCDKAY
jgi:hypothetical protein